MKVVTLVPWRSGERIREHNWAVTRPYLEALGYEMFLGDCAGPWSRSAACNAAAEEAGDWSVAVVADADTIPEQPVVARAVIIASVTKGAIRPHDQLWRLSRLGSARFEQKGPKGFHPRDATGTHLGGGLLVIHRDAWEAVGGYPETFVGWGHEDSYMGISLVAKSSWDRIEGNAWHLWHPAPNRNTPEYRTNRQLLASYRARNLLAIRKVNREKGWDVGKVL